MNILYNLPSPDKLVTRDVHASSKIYDRNGLLLYSLYKDENRTLISSEEIPQHVKLATLAAEDSEFYSHKGFSIKGMSRALYKIITEGKITGGSTITQQLIKNTLLTPEQTVVRKIKELALAILVEQKYTKDQILTMYLNEVNYGGTAYGIKEAARSYFDKSLSDLSIAEAALLAGLTKSPTQLSPFGTYPQRSIDRKNEIVELMYENGFITNSQKEDAQTEKIKFAENSETIRAPHFVMFVKEKLANKYSEDLINNVGLSIYTTLDYKLQTIVQSIITKELDSLRHLNVNNAGAIVLDAKTGDILAMAGSKDYFDESVDGNVNVTIRPRQPGSSIKPINYSYALLSGLTAASIVDDSPTTFKIDPSQPDYKPVNYDGKYRGKITLRSALAESRNIPAVKILDSYGVDKMIELGRLMGITTWEEKNRFGLSLTLGGGEVTLYDLAQVYQVFANYGTKISLNSITQIDNIDSETIYRRDCNKGIRCPKDQILPDEVAFLITDILSDNEARAPAFGRYSSLVVTNHPEVAVKTGTSNDLRDNLTVGYNQDYVVAVWVGNNNNEPMSRIASGITGASPIWNKIMTHLLAEKESIAWQVPNNIAKHSTCGLQKDEWFIKGTEPQPCIAIVEEREPNSERSFIPPGQLKKLENQRN